MDGHSQEIQSFGNILSFLGIFADSVNWSDSDIYLPAFGVVLDDESYAIPQREPNPGSSFQITAAESRAVAERTPWKTLRGAAPSSLPEVVALKIPYREDGQDVDIKIEVCLASLVKEIQILRNSYLRSHENVVSLLGVCWRSWDVEENISHVAPVLILELADEADLASFLSKATSITPTQQIRLISDICAGLQALHDIGVAHCDVKPNNFLVFRQQDEWTAKISDFGAAVWEASTGSGPIEVLEGTTAWRAPKRQQSQTIQQLMKEDVYSLTLVIFSVITLGEAGSFIVDSAPDELESLKLDDTLTAMVNGEFAKWLRSLGIDPDGFEGGETGLSVGMTTDIASKRVEPTDLIHVFRRVAAYLSDEDLPPPSPTTAVSQISRETNQNALSTEEQEQTPLCDILTPEKSTGGSSLLTAMSSLNIESLPTTSEDSEPPMAPTSASLREIDRR